MEVLDGNDLAWALLAAWYAETHSTHSPPSASSGTQMEENMEEN